MFDGPIQCDLVMDCVVRVGFAQTVMNFIRYYPIAGLAFLLFYVWRKKYFENYRIQKLYPNAKKVWEEFRQSAVTLLIFTAVATSNITLVKMKLIPSGVYFGPVEGVWEISYLFISFGLITIWHETWFYWMHRFAHHKKVYRYVHMEHHQSINPSPLAAYRFQATEAFWKLYILFPLLHSFPSTFTFYSFIPFML